MTIEYNLISFIDSLALIQGVVLGIMLMLWHRNNRPSRLLGAFLMTYALELVPSICVDLGLSKQFPSLYLLPLNFYFISAYLLYHYAQSLIQPSNFWHNWKGLLPGILEIIGCSVLFLSAIWIGEDFLELSFMGIFLIVYPYAGLVYSIYWAYRTIKLIKKHQGKVLDYFSNAANKQLKWVASIAWFMVVYGALWFVPLLTSENLFESYLYAVFSAINVVFIYWIGFAGLKQFKVEMPVQSPERVPAIDDEKEGQQVSGRQDKYQELLRLMDEHHYYRETELTLPMLAQYIKLSRKELSQLINQQAKVNFNKFVNQYRVKEAQELLVDPKYHHLNMLGIADEVGFSSKGTFFSAFKQITGVSPGVYRKEQMKQSKM